MKRLLNGYVETFFVLGNQVGNLFINHNHNSKIQVSDPLKAMKFETRNDAIDYLIQNKNNYSETLFVHEIRVTVELV